MERSGEIVLSVKNLTKQYHHEGSVLTALDEVSFDLFKGEILGVIGRNGAGKSTLLKVISEISSPSSGVVEYEGRLVSIIEIGTGFHADLSGRENVFLSASLLGHSKKKTMSMYDRIVEFSGLEGFMDTPIKHYSSGMFLRLAFSVAFHAEVDILLLDEVLAVGDREFRMKCYSKIEMLRNEGVGIILISHNMENIIEFCDRALFLEKGKVVYSGNPIDVVDYYSRYTDSNAGNGIAGGRNTVSELGSFLRLLDEEVRVNDIVFQKVDVTTSSDKLDKIYPSDDISIDFQLRKESDIGSMELVFYLLNTSGTRVLMDSMVYRDDYEVKNMPSGEYNFKCVLPKNLLSAGIYDICVMIAENKALSLDVGAVAKLKIEPIKSEINDKSMGSIIRPKLDWDVWLT